MKTTGAGLTLFLASGAACAQATFELNGTVHRFPEVSAWRVVDRYQADKMETFVMLSRTAPDRNAITQARSPYTAAINDPATEGGFLSLSVDNAGVIGLNAHIDGVQYLDSTGKIMGEQGSLKGACSENTETRIACQVNTPERVVTLKGDTWRLDANFATNVRMRAPGKPVAADGGDAGAALLALQKALLGDDLSAILALLSKDTGYNYSQDWNTPEENLKSVKEDMANMMPLGLKVRGGEHLSDDEVVLEVEGQLRGAPDKVLYSVTMVREEGSWRFQRSVFKGFL